MQNASQSYRDAMERTMLRNRAYIKVSLGVVNQLAQETATVDMSGLYYFSSGNIFSGENITQIYATAEQDFSKVDGSMYFAPSSGSGASYYNQGAVSNGLVGSIRITFGGTVDLDIKGFTIDFGDAYPTRFSIRTDAGTKTYNNDSRYFSTEDTFDGTSYVLITPISMLNGQGRLRVYDFTCGIANTFSNAEVLNYSSKEYVSPISDSLPSMDMSITIDNQDQYYNPDNPASALAYMEVGQEMTVQFGYDVDGADNIEWLPAQVAHLKTWSATDTDAKFTAVDKFDYLLNGNYIKGEYYTYGITLYNLAVAVLKDAGVTDENDYFIDNYLKKLVVYNPLPIAKYSECLQIIANAARCCLYIDREDRIHISGNFIPDATATTETGETEYSRIGEILDGKDKDQRYANASQDFSIVNNTLMFVSPNGPYAAEIGFSSAQVADASGNFTTNPVVIISLETAFIYYGLGIYFRNTAPSDFVLTYYNNNVQVDQRKVSGNTGLVWTNNEQSAMFDRLRIEFTKGYPNSRVFIDNVKFGDSTDYTISREFQLTTSPTATRQNRIQSIAVARHTYSNSTEAIKSLKSETITVPVGVTTYKDIEFSNATYGYKLDIQSFTGANSVSHGISESGAHYARIYLYLSGTAGATATVQYNINGYEYVVSDSDTTNTYHASGDIINWNNPLVSEVSMAQDIADWLGDYYTGDVTYQIPWRGDPRVDANDLFNLELKTGETALIRAYQNELAFNGGFSGSLQARKYGGD